MDVSREQAKGFVKVLAANTNEHAHTFLSAIIGTLPDGSGRSCEGDVEQLKRQRLADLLHGIAHHLLESDDVVCARRECSRVREHGKWPEWWRFGEDDVPAVVKAEFPDLFPPLSEETA